ncbi:hypothetical protein ACROYT_G027853 [Oculina patagonica]
MHVALFLSMSLLNCGFTQEKKGDGIAQDQHKHSADGPAAADEVQTKNKKYMTYVKPEQKLIRVETCNAHSQRLNIQFCQVPYLETTKSLYACALHTSRHTQPHFWFCGGVFGLYDGRMDPLITSSALDTSNVLCWGDVNDPVPC